MRADYIDTRPNLVSVFSGAMGLDLGLEAAGFNPVFAADILPAAIQTIKVNKPNICTWQGDVFELEGKHIRSMAGLLSVDVDLLAGGAPCQSFSTAGNRRSIKDREKGFLVFEFIRLVKELRPRAFLLENVKGILSASVKHRQLPYNNNGVIIDSWHGSVLREVVRRLRDIGYSVSFKELNAADYGVPQVRRRVFFVGYRDGVDHSFPEPTHSEKGDLLAPRWLTLKHAIGDLREDQSHCVQFSARKREILSLVPAGGNWRNLPEELQKESMGAAYYAKGGRTGHWRRLSWEKPSPTILTEPNNAGTCLCHPVETRPLSVAECARLQTFPDHWKFMGTGRDQYRLVGNAVPVKLAEALGRSIISRLSQAEVCTAAE
ncbi:MAG TPA: DNA cytosine methyltransferase [Azospirillaceae bacterium]|nr:DNA cytosine methyltransferase [Azospirillaceae bacterium]